MNERINELVLKARGQATSDTKDGGKCFDLDLFHKKFAELIVQECADIVLNGRAKEDEPWDHSFWNQACENRAYAIKEHFGVEK